MENFTPFNRLKTCRYGEMLFNVNDEFVGRSFDLYGEYCEGEVAIFRQCVSPESAVIEVGANMGAHTLFFAKHVGHRGRVWAFEPQRIVFQTLCANMALNHLSNVYCRNEAVGDHVGTVRVPRLDPTRNENFGGLGLGDQEHGEIMPLVTLDSLDLPRCEFLKLDVEGMEQQVLAGAAALIRRTRPVMYVENDTEDRSDALVRYIDSLDYVMYWHRTFYFNPDNFAGNKNDVFPGSVAINMLCLPKSLRHQLTGFEQVVVPAG